MSDRDDDQKLEKLLEKKREIEREIEQEIEERVEHNQSIDYNELIQESYQPTTNELDDDNPPDDD